MQKRLVLEAIQTEIARLDQILSVWRDDSEISQLNREQKISASSELYDVIAACEQWRSATCGGFDARLGQLIGLWENSNQVQKLDDQTQVGWPWQAFFGGCGSELDEARFGLYRRRKPRRCAQSLPVCCAPCRICPNPPWPGCKAPPWAGAPVWLRLAIWCGQPGRPVCHLRSQVWHHPGGHQPLCVTRHWPAPCAALLSKRRAFFRHSARWRWSWSLKCASASSWTPPSPS